MLPGHASRDRHASRLLRRAIRPGRRPAFSLPGLGGVLRDALLGNDLPVIIGVVVVSAIVIAIVNFLGEVLHASLDPRVKMHAEPLSGI